MTPISLLRAGHYSADWVKDFYDQAGIWWGADTDDLSEDVSRADTVERLCGPGVKRILELGAGAGHTAAAMAGRGHEVLAVELSPVRVQQARALLDVPRPGSLTVVEADFYTVELGKHFDVVCYWDGFGVGSDADQRRLLQRIAGCWLAPGGSVLIDVASTAWAVRNADTEERLDPLPGVPGSVEMLRRWRFDPVHCRWIDEWQPTADPSRALAQSVRCYTPADFRLLLAGTGLALRRIEAAGREVDWSGDAISPLSPFIETYSFLVQLVPERE